MRRAVICAAVLAAGCAAERIAPHYEWNDERSATPPGLSVDRAPFDEMVAELQRNLRAWVEAGSTVPPPWLFERTAELDAMFATPTTWHIVPKPECGAPRLPVADAWPTTLMVTDRPDDHDAASARTAFLSAVLLRRENGTIRIHGAIPRDLQERTTITRLSGTIRASLSERRMDADLEIELTSDDRLARVPIDAVSVPALGCGSESMRPQLTITAVDASGVGWTHDETAIWVETRPGTKTRLRVSYRARWRRDIVAADGLVAPLPSTDNDPEVDLLVMVAGVDTVMTPLPHRSHVGPAGWRTIRATGREPPFFLFLPPVGPLHTFEIGGATARWYGESADCARAAFDLLPPIAETSDIDIVEFDPSESGTSYHLAGLILLERVAARGLCDDEDGSSRRVLLHELAHEWFGGLVRGWNDEAADLLESLADYVAISSLPPELAAAHRALALEEAETSRPGLGQRIGPRDQLSYVAGPLVLWSIADRIGRDRMIAVLRHFVAANRGRRASWQEVLSSVEAVAGADAAAWAKPLIFDPVLPEIR